jgi:8-oxo-dGTP diphosphatase
MFYTNKFNGVIRLLSQAIVTRSGCVLMVKQYVERGDIVWNFPGGGIEEGESAEEACLREVREETGYDVKIKKLLASNNYKYTYLVEITGGELKLDTKSGYNEDIFDVAWIPLDDARYFDEYTRPIIDLIK